MEFALNLHCPACGAALTPRLGCCKCVSRAVQLQLRKFGTELSCVACGRHHVVRSTEPTGTQPAFGVWSRTTAEKLNIEWPPDVPGDSQSGETETSG